MREQMSSRVSTFRQALKPWILPLAMLLGVVLHNYMDYVVFLSRPLIFVMLLITYTRVPLSDFRPGRQTWVLLATQFVGAMAVYLALLPINSELAQAIFICVFCPTATAAPVVTGMLGGSVAKVATYSLFSHILVAITAPLLLSMMNPAAEVAFAASVGQVACNVLPLILGPLVIALLLRAYMPRAAHVVSTHQGLSFYIWAVALLIVVGNSVSFVMKEPWERVPEELAIAALSAVACLAQFAVGRAIGRRYGDPVAGAQALGQKNTVLAIWLAMTFLNPITSIGPAAYVAWHNTVNSWQIYRHQRLNKR